ncbi:MAG: trigger factor [Cyanobacteria bacterium SIG30]|nr:trigger factor [Cyanobacteria bacterium SIG30]
MSTKIEKLEGNIAKFDITIPQDKAQEAYAKALKKISKNLNIAGFRKGKVPDKVVEARVGVDAIKHQAIEDLFPEAFSNVVTENKLELAQQPYIETYNFEPGSDVTLTVKVELKPEVTLGEYKNVEVEFVEYKNEENAIEKEIENIKQRLSTLKNVEGRKTTATDNVVFDFEGSANGKLIEGGSAKGYMLDLANSNFIPGFAEGLIGHEIGEEFTIDVKFPENYHSEELKGADAQFKIKLLEIKERVLPEENDELAQKATNGRMKTLEELKADIQKFLEENEKMTNDRNKEKAILDKVIDEAKIDIQATMIEREKDAIKEESRQRAMSQGLDFDKMIQEEGLDKVDKQIEEEAIKRIKNSLVIEKIAMVESVKVEQADIFNQIQLIANQYGERRNEAMQEIFKNPSSIALISQQVASEKVAKMLIENNNFKAKKGDK